MTEKSLTMRQYVLGFKGFSKAFVQQHDEDPSSGYDVWNKHPNWDDARIIGHGDTRAEAWDDAASFMFHNTAHYEG